MKAFVFNTIFILIVSSFVLHCGIALTPRLTAKFPLETKTEIFRLNLPYGENQNLYGLNVGIVNGVRNDLFGGQLGIANGAHNLIGIQIGAINLTHHKHAGLKIGLVNFGVPLHGLDPNHTHKSETGIGISIGVANFEIQSGNIAIGIFNYGAGIGIGIINRSFLFPLNSEDTGLNIGIVNISETHQKQFQIGIINYCPNNTIPIMIVANYCVKE
ncbi:hypothetical protein LIX27_07705 [Leptospira borgpetersenii]|uniref:LA_2272/LA_2273 family lipoprotein n=1 Tax=Leptospira borgpetersenii TaxID=174 RepID=UPI002159871B|nr:hypothetical protein [Leptospira borgpetersenii]UVD77681.1 hypothetical protein LIX27_07705 [Leptospira borgpetersenii]